MNSTLISSCLYLQQFTAPEHPLDTPFHPSGQILVASIIEEGDCLVNPPFLKHFSTNFNPFPSRPTPSLSRIFFSLRRKKSSFRSGVRRDTMIRWPWNSDDGGSLASRPPSGEGAQSHNGITRHDPLPPTSPWHSQVRRGAFGKGKCSCVALPPFYIRLVGWITESGSSSPSRPHYAREGKRSEDFYKVVASRVLPLALAA